MKKLEIKTEKATLLVVDFSLDRGKSIAEALLCNPNLGNKEFKGFKLLGKVSEITEEEWKGIVYKSEYFGLYQNYEAVLRFGRRIKFKTASESGLSLLKANGVLLENPDKPYFISKINSEEDRAKSQEQMENYFNELSKLWSNPHVFIKVD